MDSFASLVSSGFKPAVFWQQSQHIFVTYFLSSFSFCADLFLSIHRRSWRSQQPAVMLQPKLKVWARRLLVQYVSLHTDSQIVQVNAFDIYIFFPDSKESKSFAVNMFKGQISTSQVFPFPSGIQYMVVLTTFLYSAVMHLWCYGVFFLALSSLSCH